MHRLGRVFFCFRLVRARACGRGGLCAGWCVAVRTLCSLAFSSTCRHRRFLFPSLARSDLDVAHDTTRGSASRPRFPPASAQLTKSPKISTPPYDDGASLKYPPSSASHLSPPATTSHSCHHVRLPACIPLCREVGWPLHLIALVVLAPFADSLSADTETGSTPQTRNGTSRPRRLTTPPSHTAVSCKRGRLAIRSPPSSNTPKTTTETRASPPRPRSASATRSSSTAPPSCAVCRHQSALALA